MHQPVVYDLDGTLVSLPVDWGAARDDLAADLRSVGLDPGGRDLWELLELAERADHRDRFEAVVGDHEREAAREAPELALADELRAHDGPIGVCSLNSEAACRIALDRHGLEADAVVGRDTVGSYKPDPEPLRSALSAMGVEGENAVFVGDSERDRVTAERAGVRFRWVE
ncbi:MULTISPECIES: HAD family hydrolase [Halolamina]|uniref:Phosphoglycolate phosphatase n=1 Tax=Halolamina pelagica TaxID=699431 RepID=A0A1I5Q0S7_9EURY|nr:MULTISPECIES: HAD-IA family hydrolase [Halolamina]NHX35043.1 HAD family hydrolase [Halolamina sp. R1-12]SFP39797.1 phosphoglycolate phosphatase [Halolamina pelagica]